MATLASILADVFGQCGLTSTQYDVSAATDTVDGFVLANRQAARDALDNLLRVYNCLLTEVDGKLKVVRRGGSVALTIADGDLAARLFTGADQEPERKVETKRIQELELPFRVDVGYRSKFRDYEQGTQGAARYTKGHLQEALTIDTPLVLTEDAARQVAERILYDQWVAREQFVFSLPPAYLSLVPGDVVTLPVAGNSLRVRIVQVDVALPGPIQVTAVLDDAAVLTQAVPGATVSAPGAEDTDVQTTSLVAWTGDALLNDDAASVGLYLAANGSATGFWPGAVIYWSRDSGASYQELQTVTDPATIGTAASVLAAGTTTGLFDDTNTVDVLLTAGSAPASTSDADVLSGANAALVGDEVIQYGTVTALGGSSYRLSHLLRGRRGTNGHWSEHRSGERFALLDPGPIQRVTVGNDLKNKAVLLKAVGQSQAIADVSPVTLRISGDEYKPYSPVSITASRDGPLNITLAWLRRDRKFTGLVDLVDEPMSESVESYFADVLSGTTKAITAISQATQLVITANTHGFSAGQVVFLTGISGMVELNGTVQTILSVTTNTVTIDLSSINFQPYVSGGTLEQVLRSISSSTPSVSYTSAQQVTDFGATQSSVHVTIFQVGLWGRGYPGVATV